MKRVLSVFVIFICLIFTVFSFFERSQPYLFPEKTTFEYVKESKMPKKYKK